MWDFIIGVLFFTSLLLSATAALFALAGIKEAVLARKAFAELESMLKAERALREQQISEMSTALNDLRREVRALGRALTERLPPERRAVQ